MKIGIKTIEALDAVRRNASKTGKREAWHSGKLRDSEGRLIPKSFLIGLEQQLLIYVETEISENDDPYRLTGHGELVLAAFKLGKRYG